MEEILHHLGCIKPVNIGMNYQPQLVMRINSMANYHPIWGYLPGWWNIWFPQIIPNLYKFMDFRCPQKGDNLIVAVSNRQLVTVRDPKFDLPNSDGDGTHLNRSSFWQVTRMRRASVASTTPTKTAMAFCMVSRPFITASIFYGDVDALHDPIRPPSLVKQCGEQRF